MLLLNLDHFVSLFSAFGGCLKDVEFEKGSTIQFLEDSIEVMNVNMDGCAPYYEHPDQCKDDLITEVYNGTDLQVYDTGLHSYTGNPYNLLSFKANGFPRFNRPTTSNVNKKCAKMYIEVNKTLKLIHLDKCKHVFFI